MRDEIYLQVMKQTSENPKVESCIKGWKVIQACVSSFPPSISFKDYVWSYLYRHKIALDPNAPENASDDADPFPVCKNDYISKLAADALEKLDYIYSHGESRVGPTIEKIRNIYENKGKVLILLFTVCSSLISFMYVQL